VECSVPQDERESIRTWEQAAVGRGEERPSADRLPRRSVACLKLLGYAAAEPTAYPAITLSIPQIFTRPRCDSAPAGKSAVTRTRYLGLARTGL